TPYYYRRGAGVDSEMIRLWMLSSPVMNKIRGALGDKAQKGILGFDINFPIQSQLEGSNALLVSIKASAREPQLAYNMADAMITSFRSQLMDNQLSKTQQSMAWMVERLADQKNKVEEAETKFQEYKQSIQVVSFEDQRKAEASKIIRAASDMDELANRRIQLEVEYQKLSNAVNKGQEVSDLTFKSQDIDPIPSLLQEFNTLQVSMQEKLKVFKSKHPEITTLNSELLSLRARIETEKQNAVMSFSIRIRTLKDRERVLLDAVNEYKDEAQDISDKEWQYRILERDLLINEELYHSLVKELEGTDLRGKIKSTSITVIEPPYVPVLPNSKNIVRSILKALLIGLFLGCGLVLAMDFLEMSIRSPDELERYLGIAVIGVIPEKD
ncbi:hypothetical protein K8T06_05835, partial [bacterium]|nr:hypothetical protein [bacterium]